MYAPRYHEQKYARNQRDGTNLPARIDFYPVDYESEDWQRWGKTEKE